MDSGPANTELSLHSESQSQQQDQWKESKMGGLRGWKERGQVQGSPGHIIFAAWPQGMTKIVSQKTAGLCSATELSGKSRLQSRMSRVKDIVRICIHV